jgi:hypothetical protein
MRTGDKVRVQLDMEAELAYVYSDHSPYPIVDVREAGSTVLWTVPLSAVTPVLKPEPGDIWEAGSFTYAALQRTSVLMARVNSFESAVLDTAEQFMHKNPDARLAYRKGHTS